MKKYPKPTAQKVTKKNIASSRMSRLRANLSNESIEDNRSPKNSPNTSQTSKVNLRSPSLNDSKSNIIQSPNDSQAESPSQFLAANKIISSMKAHLQEEFNNKEKPKDTFADIEQGICNQVTEYPYMKHPATPPQFSEASKLVSAIKSKLSYKANNEYPLQVNSANDRLATFRKSLGSEDMDVVMERTENLQQSFNGEMEVDVQEVSYILLLVSYPLRKMGCDYFQSSCSTRYGLDSAPAASLTSTLFGTAIVGGAAATIWTATN